MKFDPQIHRRRSIRLAGYDYSAQGLYFITVCTQDRICLFGKIKENEMILNDAGTAVQQCWLQIPDHYPHAILHEYIVMPNHLHGIIELSVGANKHSPAFTKYHSPKSEQGEKYVGEKYFAPTGVAQFKSPSQTVGSIVRGFKIGVTKWFRTAMPDDFPAPQPLWQRNYYEHIIKDEESRETIAQYILTNPRNWEKDKLHL